MSAKHQKVLTILKAILLIQLVVSNPVEAETFSAENAPQCQTIELPSNKELVDFNFMRARHSMQQYGGLKIGQINIVNLPIFNLHDPDENNVLFQFINKIHSPTQHYVIQRQLLFNEGDALNPRVLAESERILRANNYLLDAIVLPHKRCGDSLDLLVVVRDLWSLLPKLYWSRKGGNNEYGLALEDKNFLGIGDTVYFEFTNERERDRKALGYSTKNLFGTRINLDAGYSDTSDGITKKLHVARPFYALDTNWSFGVTLYENYFEESLQAFQQNITNFDHGENSYQLFAGYSAGLKQGFSRRYSFGLSRREDVFEPVNNISMIPDDRISSYPWAGISIIEDDFAIYRNLNVMYRTEDVPVGLSFSTALGYANKSLGSTMSQWVFALNLTDSPLVLDEHLLNTNLEIEGFWNRDAGDFVNTVSTIDLSYFWLMTEKQRLHIGLSYDHGINLTLDKLLPLGGDEGLRGFPSEYLLGEQRLLVNVEYRNIFNVHFLNLFRFAGVIFFDMGQTTSSENTVAGDSGLLTSTGVGIRINSSKANFSRIVHIDLAFPLNNKSELDDFQLRITGEATF